MRAETGNAGRGGEPRLSAYAPDDSAEDIFRARCKPCHGEDGKHRTKMGELHPMPDFTDPDWQGSRSDPEIRRIIEEGSTRPGSPMVGFGKRLAPAEMDELVPYVRHFKKR